MKGREGGREQRTEEERWLKKEKEEETHFVRPLPPFPRQQQKMEGALFAAVF